MNYNKAIICGRVTADPELRTTPSGQSVTSIRVATNRTWTDKAGAKQESVQFHQVVIWGKTAEVANQFLVKGSTVLIEGRLETREWEDKQGVKRWTTEIMCEFLQLGPRPNGAAPATAAPEGTGAKPYEGSDPKTLFGGDQQPSGSEEGDIKPEEIPF